MSNQYKAVDRDQDGVQKKHKICSVYVGDSAGGV